MRKPIFLLFLHSITECTLCSDRDAKQKWASSVVGSGWGMGLGGIGGQILTGAVKKGVGRVFG